MASTWMSHLSPPRCWIHSCSRHIQRRARPGPAMASAAPDVTPSRCSRPTRRDTRICRCLMLQTGSLDVRIAARSLDGCSGGSPIDSRVRMARSEGLRLNLAGCSATAEASYHCPVPVHRKCFFTSPDLKSLTMKSSGTRRGGEISTPMMPRQSQKRKKRSLFPMESTVTRAARGKKRNDIRRWTNTKMD